MSPLFTTDASYLIEAWRVPDTRFKKVERFVRDIAMRCPNEPDNALTRTARYATPYGLL